MLPIFLIGFMCSGKTTLGRAVAIAADLKFIDLDDEVEQQAGMSVSEIFATKGEDAFRQMEAAALRRCSELKDTIIACGGGTPCRPGAMQLMNQSGLTIWLAPNDDVLVERMLNGRAKRPLIKGIETKEQMADFAQRALASRRDCYALAQQTFDSSALENDAQVAASAKIFIDRFLSSN